MFYGHGGRQRGELSTPLLEITWALCLFVEVEAETFFKDISTLLTVTPLVYLQTKVVWLVLKNIFQAYPLLVKGQAYNFTLKLQHRILMFSLFFFLFCQIMLTLNSPVSKSSQGFIPRNNIHERYMIHRLLQIFSILFWGQFSCIFLIHCFGLTMIAAFSQENGTDIIRAHNKK